MKYTPSGVPVARVSLATSERFKDGNDQWQDEQNGTAFWLCSGWQRLSASTSGKERSFTLKASCRPRVGKTGRAEKRNNVQRLSLAILSCSAPARTGRTPQRRLPATDRTRSLRPRWLTTTFRSRTQDICGNLSTMGRATDRDGRTPRPTHPHPHAVRACPGALGILNSRFHCI